jgi:LAS superfamily LD-carboxypeptidase LdcB
MYSLAPTASDNTMTTTTACAFDKVASAAKQAGVTIKIASGFRTIARQEYFYNCYLTKACNNGNLAAVPGRSNHGRGIALDLNTNCGGQTGPKPNCGGSPVYQWLYNNAHNYGFTRTVQSEPWHWEYVGAGATRSSFS